MVPPPVWNGVLVGPENAQILRADADLSREDGNNLILAEVGASCKSGEVKVRL